METDERWESIRRSRPYRMAVVGLRLMVLAILMVAVVVVASLTPAPDLLIKTLILLLFVFGGSGLALTWLGGIRLIPRTWDYVGVAGGLPDLRRGSHAVRGVLQDTTNLRFW